jgi:hypothetical protein
MIDSSRYLICCRSFTENKWRMPKIYTRPLLTRQLEILYWVPTDPAGDSLLSFNRPCSFNESNRGCNYQADAADSPAWQCNIGCWSTYSAFQRCPVRPLRQPVAGRDDSVIRHRRPKLTNERSTEAARCRPTDAAMKCVIIVGRALKGSKDRVPQPCRHAYWLLFPGQVVFATLTAFPA